MRDLQIAVCLLTGDTVRLNLLNKLSRLCVACRTLVQPSSTGGTRRTSCGVPPEALHPAATGLPAEPAGRYCPAGFIGGEPSDVLALADVVVSRSGAGTLAELTTLGKPAVSVPLASAAGNKQVHNTRHPEEVGAPVALTGEVTAARLQAATGSLLADARPRWGMAERSRASGRPDAADRIVDEILAAAAGQSVTLEAGRRGEPSLPR